VVEEARMTFIGAIERTFMTILRSRELFTLAILSVLFYGFYYPAPYEQQTVQDVNLVVVDADHSPLSRLLVRHVNDTEQVNVVLTTGNMGEARELVRSREADGILYFAPGMGAQLLNGRSEAGIALWLNGAYIVRAEAVATALADVALDTAEELKVVVPSLARQERQPVLLQPMFTTGGYRDYVFPAVANIILQQTLLAASARLVADRRRAGWQVMSRVEACGMFAACVMIGILAAGLYFGLIYWIQDVPRAGNMPALLLSIPLFAFAVVGLGMFVGSLFRDGDDALKIVLPTSLPLVFLGGFAWPLYEMPVWLSTAAWLSPATAAMHLFIRFNQMASTLSEAGGPFLVIGALAIIYPAAFLFRVGQLNKQAAARPTALVT